LDEAQYIKNETTSRSKHAKMLVANHRFALTGTPLENKESDLINIFDFVMPSLNEKYNLKSLSRSILREYVSPFLLRRKKTDVLSELPEKNTIVVELDMNDEQRSIYDTYKCTHANENDQYLEILALLTKLRQICVSPQLVNANNKTGSTKLDYMFELIDNIIESNESVLIYSFFASAFDIIEPLMKEKKLKYVRLDGSVSPDDRPALIDSFDNNDDIHCFLISLKAGGVGLNLTKANNVIFLDPWWNIAVENQAADRTHRIGQTKKVTIYRLVCKDTIEEKVLDIQKEKLDLINFFVESNGDDPLGKLTVDMMKELLK
jgi:SNF2 family DNA or RNA helicase